LEQFEGEFLMTKSYRFKQHNAKTQQKSEVVMHIKQKLVVFIFTSTVLLVIT